MLSFEYEPIDASQLADRDKRLWEELQAYAASKNITVTYSRPAPKPDIIDSDIHLSMRPNFDGPVRMQVLKHR